MKVYITGCVGSGKSTLARRIAGQLGIPCCHLDEITYVEAPDEPWGNRKRPADVRDALFEDVLQKPHWVMEDAGRACFARAVEDAEVLILLLPHPLVVRWRILLRWIRQNLGIEKCIYRPSLHMLRAMFRWAWDWETGENDAQARLTPFAHKTVVLRTTGDVNRYLCCLEK